MSRRVPPSVRGPCGLLPAARAQHSHRAAERAPRTPAQPTFVNRCELRPLISQGATPVCFLPPCGSCPGSTMAASPGDQGPLACKTGKGRAPWSDTVWGPPGDLAEGPGLPVTTQTKPRPGATVRTPRGRGRGAVTEPRVLVLPSAGSRSWRGPRAHPRGCPRFTQSLLTLNQQHLGLLF